MATQPLHLGLVLRGGYKPSQTEISDEIWVNTVKVAIQLDGFTEGVGTIPNNFEVVHAALSDSDTGWSASSDWRLEGGISDFDPVSYLVDQVMPAALSWMSLTGRSNTCILRQVDLYPVDIHGHAIGAAGYGAAVPATLTFDAGSEPTGGSSGNYAPLQTACVTSHRTAYSGRKGRGRMFLAGLASAAIDSMGQFTSTFMNNALAGQVAFLEALTMDSAAPYTHAALIPNGTQYALINEVRVGSVPDTQRRRRNALTETFVTDAVT